MKVLKAAVKNHPIESTATLIGLIVVGIGVALGREAGWIGLLGDLLTILGTFLAGVASAWTFGMSAARRNFVNRLEILTGQLVTASGHISSALPEEGSGEEPEVCFARIQQAVGTLSGLIRDLDKMTGRQLETESAGLLGTRRGVADLGRQLLRMQSELYSDAPSKIQLQDLTAIMQSQVSRVLDSLELVESPKPSQRGKVREVVECPYCREQTAARLGSRPGDTASAVCESCGRRFNTHRGTGGILTRELGATGKEERRMSVERVLASHKLSMPPPQAREEFLAAVQAAWKSGRIKKAADLIESVQEAIPEAQLDYNTKMPLFWALINRDYGPIKVREAGPDDLPLLDQPVESFHDCSEEDFIRHAHAAWIAQALFRIQGRRFPRSEVLEYLFGSEPTSDQLKLVALAEDFLQRLTIAEDRPVSSESEHAATH